MATQYIAHRINTLEALRSVPRHFGVEIDLREKGNDIVLVHDSFNTNDESLITFEHFLQNYNCLGTLILNVKCEGIEERCIGLVKKYNITNWFFLDLSMPYAVKYSLKTSIDPQIGFAPANMSVRFSEYEPIEYALSFSSRCSWVWVDCFTKMPLTQSIYKQLKVSQFKICLVSPELQGHSLNKIHDYKAKLLSEGMNIDAICTKRADLWEA